MRLFIVIIVFNLLYSLEPSAFEYKNKVVRDEFKALKSTNDSLNDKIHELSSKLRASESSLEGLKSLQEGNSSSLMEMSSKLRLLETRLASLEGNAESGGYKDIRGEIDALKSESATHSLKIEALSKSLDEINASLREIKSLFNSSASPLLEETSVGKSGEKSSTGNSPINFENKIALLTPPPSSESASSNVVVKQDDQENNKEKDQENNQEKDKKAQKITKKQKDKPITHDSEGGVGGSQNKGDKDAFIHKSCEDIFKEARSLTYRKSHDAARARFKHLISINCRAAEANYMLGNIAYETNKYNDAIYFYKQSTFLDDGAAYMPRLLLNSANSFRVLRDLKNAKAFYNSLIELYPDTPESKEAINKIKGMQ